MPTGNRRYVDDMAPGILTQSILFGAIFYRTWCADPPGAGRTHVGNPLALRPRSNGGAGWEITDALGVAVGQMSSKFRPPVGEIVAVRVAAMLVRQAREDEKEKLQCPSWELVLPEIEYLPG